MLRVVEKHPLGVIQKVTTPKGAVRFQTMSADSVVTPYPTLAEARKALGVVIKHPEKLTTPKSDCPHNQPGYKPGNSSSASKAKKK